MELCASPSLFSRGVEGVKAKSQSSQMCVLLAAIVMVVTFAVLFMPGKTEAGWSEDRFLYSAYTSWRHYSYYYNKLFVLPMALSN